MSRAGRTYRVLIVDDNLGDHRLFQEAITELALPILMVSCESAKAALAVLASDHEFNLVLTDLNMPQMSGIQLCAHLEAHPEWRKIPMILMSSNPKKTLPTALVGECKTPYLVKPTSWNQYLTFIRELHVLLGAGTGQ